jgi:hypothetical protein
VMHAWPPSRRKWPRLRGRGNYRRATSARLLEPNSNFSADAHPSLSGFCAAQLRAGKRRCANPACRDRIAQSPSAAHAATRDRPPRLARFRRQPNMPALLRAAGGPSHRCCCVFAPKVREKCGLVSQLESNLAPGSSRLAGRTPRH